ncbi:MAG: hypothetical protein L0Z73_02960, partial [Gammaproteobacteria bacterium]|nr:hypothetical protein [Gammaproteobacteria bacterium]
MEEKQLTPEQISRLKAENIASMNIAGREITPTLQQTIAAQKPVKRRPPQYSGAIIVRLSSEVPPATKKCKSLSEMAKEKHLRGLEKVLDEYDLSISAPLVKSMDPDKILELEKRAAKTEFPPVHSLTSYWRIDAREKSDKIDEILKRLNSLFEVDKASLELSATDPLVNAADDPYNATQDYLDAAPEGIDARWAWTQMNGEGAGVGFVDLEQGWFPGHEDYASKSPAIVYGDNRDGIG